MRAVLIVFMLVSFPALGAEPDLLDEAEAAGAAAIAKNEQGQKPVTSSGTVTAFPASPGEAAMTDPATRAKYLASLQSYYDYRSSGYSYRARVFEWQLLSSRFIFVIVVLLVLAGMYFAAVQFHVALATARRNSKLPQKEGSEGAPPAAPFATQLEISAKGIVVNSSVLGVIIVSLSLAFFYLYLVYVYPVNDTF
jgi:hypothetical protein